MQQWRVLRFNDVTRQSVAKVTIAHHTRSAPINSSSQTAPVAGSRQGKGTDTSSEEAAPEVRADSPFGGLAGSAARSTSSTPGRQAGGGYLNDQDSHRPPEPEWTIVQQADCLAPEYLKSMASLAAAIIGMQGLLSRAGTLSDAENQMRVPISMRGEGGEGEPPLRILCIGLGGGSLPLFLAHHFPKVQSWDPMAFACRCLKICRTLLRTVPHCCSRPAQPLLQPRSCPLPHIRQVYLPQPECTNTPPP